MCYRAISAIFFVAAFAWGGSASAALSYVGACADAGTNACVITDGSFEYLSLGGARVNSAGLADLQTAGWTLGTRSDFAAMVAHNAPLSTASWNDVFIPDGPDADTLPDVIFGSSAVIAVLQNNFADVITARSGDPVLAAAFKDIILKFGGQNANPAYALSLLGTADVSGATRYTVGMQAYLTDEGVSISRNNTFSGASSTTTRDTSVEAASLQRYFLLRGVTAPVPEPQVYAMLLCGLGLVRAIARRRGRRGHHLR